MSDTNNNNISYRFATKTTEAPVVKGALYTGWVPSTNPTAYVIFWLCDECTNDVVAKGYPSSFVKSRPFMRKTNLRPCLECEYCEKRTTTVYKWYDVDLDDETVRLE